MIKHYGKFLSFVCFLVLGGLVQSGCVAVLAAGAGAGTVAYVRGQLNTPLEASMDRSVRAVSQAIDDMRYSRISEETDATSAVFVARNAQDKKITIRLTRQTDNLTDLSIRVGAFGDEKLSQTILDAIKKRL